MNKIIIDLKSKQNMEIFELGKEMGEMKTKNSGIKAKNQIS